MHNPAGQQLEADALAPLKRLALEGGLDGSTLVTCSILAEQLEVSSQTASRRLQRLENDTLIDREITGDGQRVAITEAGERVLRQEYADYQSIFEDREGVRLTGAITSGMGEGRHYISLPGYMRQFEGRLGYTPFAGTLNLQLDEEGLRSRMQMDTIEPVSIDGWTDEDRTYGPAFCWPARLETTDGQTATPAHVIAPERTHHDVDQMEIIAPEKLRDTLTLEDGDRVEVHVAQERELR
jgi:riboflavin kinase